MGSLREIAKTQQEAVLKVVGGTPKTTRENVFKTSGDIQGEDVSSSSESSTITRGSTLNYRDKQKRQGLFGNIGTILGN